MVERKTEQENIYECAVWLEGTIDILTRNISLQFHHYGWFHWFLRFRNIHQFDWICMVLCHVCALQTYEKDGTVVLPCAHVMCQECLKVRLDLTTSRDKVECPKCAGVWQLPFGDILAFPQDTFSLVLSNNLLGTGLPTTRPNPKCAVHKQEDVSSYCKQCSLPVGDGNSVVNE